ncbi:T9SS type A sorting domain-containing protein [Algibacter amylolyticus]|nr:T9SS type A sorting domain-containing protein [Algibacter amylolyticus]MBB5267878.1 hypothetical protein [Algibacter amylolyticus]
MKKITLLFAILGLQIGTLNLNAQTVILDQTFDATYASSTANGKTAWGPNQTLILTDYADGFGFINPSTGWSNSSVSSCSWLQGFLTLGSPGNGNTTADEEAWFTFTKSGLTIGNMYQVEVPVVRKQGRPEVDHTLHAWSTTPPSTNFASANSLYTTTTGLEEPEELLTKNFVADATTMTFGVGIGRDGTVDMFNKTRILSMKITDLGTTLSTDNDVLKNSFTVVKTGVTLKAISGNVQIIDLFGRLLASKQLKNNETLNYQFNNTSIYVVRLTSNMGSLTKKVVFK